MLAKYSEGRNAADSLVQQFAKRADRRERAECKKEAGWKRKGNKCVRVSPEERKKKRRRATAIAVGTAVPLGVAAIGTAAAATALYKAGGVEPLVEKITGAVYEKTNNGAEIDKAIKSAPLPKGLKEKMLNLSGRNKRFLTESLIKSAGGELVNVDEKNDIATFKGKDGSIYSTSSVNENLVVFASQRETGGLGNNEYEMSFQINYDYARPTGGREKDTSSSRGILSKTKKMFRQHVDLIEDDSILKVEAFDEDDAGKKRQRIYEKMGFTDLPVEDNYLWALKSGGQFAKIPEAARLQVAKIVSYNRDSLLERLDKKSQSKGVKEGCDPKYKRWKKKGNKCVRVKTKKRSKVADEGKYVATAAGALALAGIAATADDENTALKYGAAVGSAMLGATLFAMPLMEAASRNKTTNTTPKIPDSGISEEALMAYNKKFKRGDMVRAKFAPAPGVEAYHVGIYMGPDQKTGEPTILHVSQLANGKGNGVNVSSMRPRHPKIYWEYEKMPKQRRVSEAKLDRALKALEPTMNKRIDYNMLDKNCEMFAKIIAGKRDTTSSQVADMSKTAQTLGRGTIGTTLSAVNTKGKKAEVTFADVERLLKEASRTRRDAEPFDHDEVSPSNLDWKIYAEPTEEGYKIISPNKALAIANFFPKGSEAISTEYLKNYFLFISAARILNDEVESTEKKEDSKAICKKPWKRSAGGIHAHNKLVMEPRKNKAIADLKKAVAEHQGVA